MKNKIIGLLIVFVLMISLVGCKDKNDDDKKGDDQPTVTALEKINKVIQREVPDGPHETLLVIDATTGQNGMSQAEAFSQITNITGIILTKLDGTSKGGIVLAIRDKFNFPIKFVGLGEGLDDLEYFDLELL